MSHDNRWGKPRKNVKRRDPRYFMDEKMETLSEVSQGEAGLGSFGGEGHLAQAVVKALTDGRHDREENPLSLSALFDSQTGIVRRHLEEFGLDQRGIQSALASQRKFHGGGEFMDADGRPFTLGAATVRVGSSAGEQGLYLAS